jgi:O-antigen ligase
MFFLPMSFAKIIGISITFFIFLFICFIFLRNKKKIFRLKNIIDYLILIFFSILMLSMIYGEDTYRPRGEYIDIKLGIQMVYWSTLALFLKTWIHEFDFYQLSKYLFFGLFVVILAYFTIGAITQNSFAYTMVLSVPIVLYYVFRRFSLSITIIISILLLVAAVASGSRAGSGIIFLQIVLYFLSAKIISKKTIGLMLPLITLFLIMVGMTFSTLNAEISDIIRPLNPDLAELIYKTDQVLTEDRSWLERKQYIIKGLMIFEEHPFMGIGITRFKYYWVDMPLVPELYKSLDFLNKHSPHNSYIQILAGSGIFALIAMLIMQFLVILKGIKVLISFHFDYKLSIVLSFIGMSIYFYVIAQAIGSITWVIMGLGFSLLKKDNR